jgi:hypothetical protein
MRDHHLLSCWVASTPSTRVWRHPCVVLIAQLLLRHAAHCARALRDGLPRAGARAARRLAGGALRWLGPREEAAAAAGAAQQQPEPSCEAAELPLELLQCLGAWLPAADAAAARLVCRSWRDCLGAQVATAHLTPALWQHGARGQLAQLRALTDAFPLLRTLDCAYQRGAPVDARTARRTMGFLARTTPSLAGLRLRGMADAASWPALAEGLAPLAPQLARLDLQDACWPDAASTAALAGRLDALTRLRFHSAVFSRMANCHVAAVAGLQRLRELSLVGLGGGRGWLGVGLGGCCSGALRAWWVGSHWQSSRAVAVCAHTHPTDPDSNCPPTPISDRHRASAPSRAPTRTPWRSTPSPTWGGWRI